MLKGVRDGSRRFVGSEAIRRELEDGSSRWATTGIVVDWADWDRLHRDAGELPTKDEQPLGWEQWLRDDERRAGRLRHQLLLLTRAAAAHRTGPRPARARRARRHRPSDGDDDAPHHQHGRGQHRAAAVLQPRPEDGPRMSTFEQRPRGHAVAGHRPSRHVVRRHRRRRRPQRARQRGVPLEGRPAHAGPRAAAPGRRRGDHRGAAARLLVHHVLLRAEPAAAGDHPRARPGRARVHAADDARRTSTRPATATTCSSATTTSRTSRRSAGTPSTTRTPTPATTTTWTG